MDTTTFQTQKDILAARIGIDSQKIGNISLQLDMLRKQGLLIDLNIAGTGMFTRQANFMELGIGFDVDDERTRRYTAGSKYLIPRDYVDQLKSVETRMRNLVYRYGLEVTGFAPYRWLPVTSYWKFREQWEGLLDEFNDAKAQIIARMPEFTDNLADEFAAGARRSWQSIVSQGYTAMISKNSRGDVIRTFTDGDAYVDAVVQSALSMLPTVKQVEDGLRADYRINMVTTDLDAAEQQAQAEIIRERANAEKRTAYMQTALLEQQFQQNQRLNELATEKAELERDELSIKVQAMMAAELEHAKEQLATMRSPFEEVFVALRQQMAKDAQDMLESVQKSGFLRGKVAEKGAGLLSFFDLMAVHSDKELRDKLMELKAQIGPIGDSRDKDTAGRDANQIAATLQQIVDLAHIEAQHLTEISKAAFVEL